MLTTDTEVNVDQIFSNVARNAILNADGRADDVRCYPGTREEVIGEVEKWMNGEGGRMMWLSGPAGAGKSAICQTVAERCRKRRQHQANFFFFRGDGTRNRAEPLVTTLVYQLRRRYRGLDAPLSDCLMADPLICSASVEEQFAQLISSPIETLQQSSAISGPIVLIIDGLDECDNKRKQEQILFALHALTDADHSPFRILVASRAESHLVMAFNQLGASVESIFLDDEYKPQDDIHRFVTAKFDEIKRAHCLAHTLETSWPAEEDIAAITDKSSGQFIYAATVMQFIHCSPDSPALSLRTILKMRPRVSPNPLAQLDAVYSYVFSKARDIWTIKLILGAHLVTAPWRSYKFGDLLDLFGHGAIEIESLFVDLGAIIQVTSGPDIELVFYHESLSDYLEDESRSGPYHISRAEIVTALSLTCLERFHDSRTLRILASIYLLILMRQAGLFPDTWDITILVLREVEEPAETLTKALLNASTVKLQRGLQNGVPWFILVRAIRNMYFQTDPKMFKTMLRHWVRFGYRNCPNNLHTVSTRTLPPSALTYYQRHLIIERLKLALGLSR